MQLRALRVTEESSKFNDLKIRRRKTRLNYVFPRRYHKRDRFPNPHGWIHHQEYHQSTDPGKIQGEEYRWEHCLGHWRWWRVGKAHRPQASQARRNRCRLGR